VSQQSILAREPSECHFDSDPELGEVVIAAVFVSVAIELGKAEWDEQFIQQWEGVVDSAIVSPISNVLQPVNPLLQLVTTPVCSEIIATAKNQSGQDD
jgi:hypothetical protein